MPAFSISLDLAGLGLDQLTEGAEKAIRPAAQAGAQVFYDHVKANVAKLGKKTGNLDGSIYQAFNNGSSGPGHAQYTVSWNQQKAPHGHLVEFGHVQRYVVYVDQRGQWKTLVRASMVGKRKPPRKAPQSVKDAYYVPLKGGPRIVPPKSFIRSAATPEVARAVSQAMFDRYWLALKEMGLL